LFGFGFPLLLPSVTLTCWISMFIRDPLNGGDGGGTIPGNLAFHDVVRLQVLPTFGTDGTVVRSSTTPAEV
jgi:hypothetical protein